MGGELYINIVSKDTSLENEIFDFIVQSIDSLIDVFNFFDENSLISTLNEKRVVPFHSDLAFVLTKSFEFNSMSGGIFNICLGKESRKRKADGVVDNDRIPNRRNENSIQITPDEITLIDSACDLDLGGIAKGYIIDKALELVIKRYGDLISDVFLDARGDCVTFGKGDKLIEVENPFDSSISFSKINLPSGAVITSGHNKQKFADGSHIIGNYSDILTISLYSPERKCFELDALGTYLLQLHSSEVLEKIEFDPYYSSIECLIILENGDVFRSAFWNDNT